MVARLVVRYFNEFHNIEQNLKKLLLFRGTFLFVGKRFRQRVSYLVHRRIHTGVMPYKCTACNKSFRYKVSQRSHKCPVNPPGSVVRIPDSEKPPETSVPSPKNVQHNGKCIMSVDLNTGNINLIADDNKGGATFATGGGFQENAQIQKESILLNNNEEIEIRYNKADLQLAINKPQILEERKGREEEDTKENSSGNISDCAQNSLGKFEDTN